jgi:SAM-dependent methyltransferase
VTDFAGVGTTYGEQLARGLSLTGESASYFAHRRVARMREWLDEAGMQPRAILDFGCGSGAAFAPLRSAFADARIIGFEPDRDLRAVAVSEAVQQTVDLLGSDVLDLRAEVDVVYCNGVFHHIPRGERADAMQRIRTALRPGGHAIIWENSPFNPGTRWIMSRIPFDRHARLLTPRALRKLQRSQGLEPELTEFHFVFPRSLAFLRRFESMLQRWPFGGQYVVVGRAS